MRSGSPGEVVESQSLEIFATQQDIALPEHPLHWVTGEPRGPSQPQQSCESLRISPCSLRGREHWYSGRRSKAACGYLRPCDFAASVQSLIMHLEWWPCVSCWHCLMNTTWNVTNEQVAVDGEQSSALPTSSSQLSKTTSGSSFSSCVIFALLPWAQHSAGRGHWQKKKWERVRLMRVLWKKCR